MGETPPARAGGHRLLGAVLDVVAGLAVAAALVAIVATQFMGYRILGIASDSMLPALARGDLIVSRPVAITSVEHDDIIVFEEGQQTKLLVAHRVVNIIKVNTNITDSKTGAKHTEESRIFRTKGDANPVVDAQPVDAAAFRGLLMAQLPGAGGLLGSATIQQGLVALALVAGLAWLGYELLARGRRRSQANR